MHFEKLCDYTEGEKSQLMSITPFEDFGKSINGVEEFFNSLPSSEITGSQILDLSSAGFVKPMGIMALISSARQMTQKSGNPITLVNVENDLLAYLERMDVFRHGSNWIQLEGRLPEKLWERDPQTNGLLELTPITSSENVATVVDRAQKIFSHWLQLANLNSLLNVISELCSNIHQHSGDPHGFVLIQRYQSQSRNEVDVVLAAGDMGQGIRGSLQNQFPDLGTEPADYIKAAMEGKTSRKTGRGGLGLRRVEEAVAKAGGYIWLRSETAAVHSTGPGKRHFLNDLTYMPGTQVVVELRSPLVN